MPAFGPKHTAGLEGAAEAFCLLFCRRPDDTCPLGCPAEECPLWRFVDADLPTTLQVGLRQAENRSPGNALTGLR
jgi:hypothetical protein